MMVIVGAALLLVGLDLAWENRAPWGPPSWLIYAPLWVAGLVILEVGILGRK